MGVAKDMDTSDYGLTAMALKELGRDAVIYFSFRNSSQLLSLLERGTSRKYHPAGAPEHVCRRGAGLQSSHRTETLVGKIVEPEDTGGAAEMGGLLLVCGILEKTCKMRDSIATLRENEPCQQKAPERTMNVNPN